MNFKIPKPSQVIPGTPGYWEIKPMSEIRAQSQTKPIILYTTPVRISPLNRPTTGGCWLTWRQTWVSGIMILQEQKWGNSQAECETFAGTDPTGKEIITT